MGQDLIDLQDVNGVEIVKEIIASGLYGGHQVALDCAHFGNGSSISSDVVLVNLAATPIRPAVYFYDKAGGLIDPGSVVDVMGNPATTDYGALTLQSELAPLGEITISTNGRDARFIDEMIDTDTSNFDGPVRCTAPAGQQKFTGVAVETDTENGIFTTLPVVPPESEMPSQEETTSETTSEE